MIRHYKRVMYRPHAKLMEVKFYDAESGDPKNLKKLALHKNKFDLYVFSFENV